MKKVKRRKGKHGKLNVRRREMQRLIWYAQGMECNVVIRKHIPGSHDLAVWELFADNSVLITIYRKKRQSDLQMVLSIIHELGHHRDFITQGRRDTKDPYTIKGQSKEDRKKIYNYELRAMRYWRQIYQDTNCSFPIGLLYMQMEIDIKAYEYYYLTGKERTGKIREEHRRAARQRYKEGYEAENEDVVSIWKEDTDEEEDEI